MPQDNNTPVSQAAREAAAPVAEESGWWELAERIREGNRDNHPMVQAFARFEHSLREREPAPSNERIPNALWPFIQHDKDCVLRGHWMEAAEHDCDCGLADALTTQEPAPSSERELLREARDWLSSIGLPGGVTDDLRDRIDAYLASATQEPALDLHTLTDAFIREMDARGAMFGKPPLEEDERKAVAEMMERALKGGEQ